jgi:hypothetical protein
MSKDEFAQVDFTRSDVRSSLVRAYEVILAWQPAEGAPSPRVEGEIAVQTEQRKSKSHDLTGEHQGRYYQECMF